MWLQIVGYKPCSCARLYLRPSCPFSTEKRITCALIYRWIVFEISAAENYVGTQSYYWNRSNLSVTAVDLIYEFRNAMLLMQGQLLRPSAESNFQRISPVYERFSSTGNCVEIPSKLTEKWLEKRRRYNIFKIPLRNCNVHIKCINSSCFCILLFLLKFTQP